MNYKSTRDSSVCVKSSEAIVKGLSYEKMDEKVYQNIGKGDFYGHQRKTLAIFRAGLIECGRYPFATC